MSILSIPVSERRTKRHPYVIPVCLLCLTLSGSNYPCLEQSSKVPKMFKPLRFDCIVSITQVLFYSQEGEKVKNYFLPVEVISLNVSLIRRCFNA